MRADCDVNKQRGLPSRLTSCGARPGGRTRLVETAAPKDTDAVSSLMLRAIRDSDAVEVQRQLDSGDDADAMLCIEGETGEPHHVTALCLAAGLGQMQTAGVLLDHKADPNKPCDGATPLMEAASAGQVEMLELLVSKGATLNVSRELLLAAVSKIHCAGRA